LLNEELKDEINLNNNSEEKKEHNVNTEFKEFSLDLIKKMFEDKDTLIEKLIMKNKLQNDLIKKQKEEIKQKSSFNRKTKRRNYSNKYFIRKTK